MVQNYGSYAALLRALQKGLARSPEHATRDNGEAPASESAQEEEDATFAADGTIDPSTPVLLAELESEAPRFDRPNALDAPDGSLPCVSSYAEYIALHAVAEANLGGAVIDELDTSMSSLEVSAAASEVDATLAREGFVEPDDTLGSVDRDEQSSVGYFSSYPELVARYEAEESGLVPVVNDGIEAIDRLEMSLPSVGVVAAQDVVATPAQLEDPCGTRSKMQRRRRSDRRAIVPNYCWLTYQEAADYAGWSIEHLRNLVSAGKIPVYGEARVRRFRQDMLDLFLADPGTAMRKFSQEKEKHHGR